MTTETLYPYAGLEEARKLAIKHGARIEALEYYPAPRSNEVFARRWFSSPGLEVGYMGALNQILVIMDPPRAWYTPFYENLVTVEEFQT